MFFILLRLWIVSSVTFSLTQFGDHETESRLKAIGSGIFGNILKSDNCRPEVASDVMTGLAVAYTKTDVRVKLGDDSWLNIGQINRHVARRSRFGHLHSVFN